MNKSTCKVKWMIRGYNGYWIYSCKGRPMSEDIRNYKFCPYCGRKLKEIKN